MRLAFSGQARHPDFSDGYTLYRGRTRTGCDLDMDTYRRVVREYCRRLALRLEEEGCVDLPFGLGLLSAVTLNRKPQYRGDKFVGYGSMNWKEGVYDGSPKAFGIAFLPNWDRNHNLRCYGFVANRRLFLRMKGLHDGYGCPWTAMELNDEMI